MVSHVSMVTKDVQLEEDYFNRERSTVTPLDRATPTDSFSVPSNNSIHPSIHHLPTQPVPTPFLPSSLFPTTSNRLLSPKQTTPKSSHRRNQSHGHISFPKFTMPPNLVITNPTPDNQFNPFSSGARSVPSTPGVTPFYPLHINNTMGHSSSSTTTAAASIANNTTTSSLSGASVSASGEKENFSLADLTSSVVEAKGQIPPALIGSTTVIHNNHLYLFGGRPPGKTPTNGLYILNFETNVWTLVNQEQQQLQAYQHADDAEEEIEQSSSTDQHEDDTLSQGGRGPPKVKKSKEPREIGHSPLCAIPQPRYYHSATLVVAPPILDSNGSIIRWGGEDEAHLVIFGGRGLSQNGSGEVCLNDAHILDLTTLQWIPSNLNSNHDHVGHKTALDEVSKHEHTEKETIDSDSTSFPAQGSQESTLPLQQNQHEPFRFHTPEPRSAHVASIKGDHLLIIGGLNLKNEYIHSISVLDLKRHVWIDGGEFRGNASQYRASSASMEEKPMARRRRRYLECLASETLQYQQRPLSIHGALSSLSSHSPALTDATTASNRDLSALSPLSPNSHSSMLSPLLNPRKNSWHRGEGLPFEIPKSPPSLQHQNLMNEFSGLSSMIEPDDYVWVDDGKQQDSGFVGLGMDLNGQNTQDGSASVLTLTPSIAGNSKSPHMSSQISVSSTAKSATEPGLEKTRSRSSSVQSPTPIKLKGTGPVTHAVPKTFFSKSNGGLFELDGLATTIARDNKSSSPKGSDTASQTSFSSDKQSHLRRSSSNGTSSISSRRSSRAADDNMVTRRIRRELEVDDKADKRRSLDSVLDSVNILETSFAEGRVLSDSLRSQYIPTPYSQPFYIYSNRTSTDHKLKREFLKIQTTKGLYRPNASKLSFDTKPEWTALDLGPEVNLGPRNQCPPKLYFPATHIVDNNFILSGNSVLEEDISDPREQDSSAFNQISTVFSTTSSKKRRRSFSVWVHQFHNHQWSQLELSKSLYSGVWNHSVLDREGNFLYILGQRKPNPNQSNPEAVSKEHDSGTELALSVTSFSHLIKVDLEGLEISPDVDESCVGASGLRLGLEMLKDGVGADVVLVSSVDGGRVHVNSGIVGQRWGYFQLLMEENNRVRSTELEFLKSKQDSTQDEGQESKRTSPGTDSTLASKKWCLSDTPPEIMVRESTPILVAFLQYLYTNELVTPHQLKIKTLQGLLLVAHFYDLTRLQQLVRRAIHQQLNAKNAAAVCEVAVLTNEFGLQTRAIRTLIYGARMAQMRQKGEAAEAKRRFEFAMCRLEEIEEDRKRKANLKANQILLQQASRQTNLVNGATIGNNSNDNLNNGINKNGTQGNVSAGSMPAGTGLSAFGRFFRHREESVESVGPLV